MMKSGYGRAFMKRRKHGRKFGSLNWGKGQFNGTRSIDSCNFCKQLQSNSSGQCFYGQTLLQNYTNFKKSGLLKRVMFFWSGQWNDFSEEATETLKEAFSEGKASVHTEIDGSSYLVDFFRMLQVDLSAGCHRSISWIDVNENCFFPKLFLGDDIFDDAEDPSGFEFEIEIQIDESKGSKVDNGVKGSKVDHEVTSLEDENMSEVSKAREKNYALVSQCNAESPRFKEAERNSKPINDVTEQKVDSLEKLDRFQCKSAVEELPIYGSDKKMAVMKELVSASRVRDANSEERDGGALARVGKVEEFQDNHVNQKEEKTDCIDIMAGLEKKFQADGVNLKKRIFGPGSLESTKPEKVMDFKGFVMEQSNEMPSSCVVSRKRLCVKKETCTLPLDVAPFSRIEPSIEEHDATISAKGATNAITNDIQNCNLTAIDIQTDGSSLTATRTSQPTSLASEVLPTICAPILMSKPDDYISNQLPRFASLGTKLVKLNDGNKAYVSIKRLFLSGFQKEMIGMISVDAIYGCSYASAVGLARLQTFQRHIEMTKNSFVSANVMYAWHGTSAKGVESIILHGFGRPVAGYGSDAYGIGIYLTPEGYPHLSVLSAEPDDNGLHHLVLCRVIMGNMEQVQCGSAQFHPRNVDFDSGVEDLCNRRRSIIWSTHMNTHILPVYVVSIKVPDPLKEVWRNEKSVQEACGVSEKNRPASRFTPQTARSDKPSHMLTEANGQSPKTSPLLGGTSKMSFPTLFSVIGKYLSPSTVGTLEHLYNEFKAGKIGKDTLIGKVRSIAGDKVLIAAINSIRSQAEMKIC
ncbi:inactive poly [ADP-ribose] polymerase RCD1 [Amborella trichopoda]|uniref:inactive poly [ADP-ribose] polymerase RCD1 n=1 Tax=Amborella trichopoda TaxID=13333 RepID=UPI0005D2F226|nr:inactive poly [ADP-ribose] polymerase RCD1 [Amborella trichopoda]|eukprot:XP_011626768.1 inactive poly [ADP-ribose] polymerase RCD1 [Amborella trichopoda]